MTTRAVTWTWTNWTFGVWYARFGKYKQGWGIDIGPFEIVWKRSTSNGSR